MTTTTFPWPNGKRAAISLTFDDARLSQLDSGIPILDRFGLRATFYVTPSAVEQRLDGWRQAIATGHEIGNHTVTHPCSGNFSWAREKGNPLEEFTLERMDAELIDANAWIAKTLGATPQTFAYPCGETTISRGATTQSYVPLVARHFLAGRGYNNEVHNAPMHCDLARLWSAGVDGANFAHLRALVETTRADGGWLILTAHEIGEKARQTLSANALERLCEFVTHSNSAIWVDTVAAIATHVAAQRNA